MGKIAKLKIFYRALRIYLAKKECPRFRDCLLLAKLQNQQPVGADRVLEYPWLVKNFDLKSGRVLDVGTTNPKLLSALLPKNIKLWGINSSAISSLSVKMVQGDIRKTKFPDNFFDAVICISTLEHIGVAGRYGSDHDSQGDTRAMKEISRILKKGGMLFLTVPYGVKDVLPVNKLYNRQRMKKLLTGYEAIDEEYRKYTPSCKLWLPVTQKEAAKTDMISDRWYAIYFLKARKK